jgi:ADP-ribose pyrophosphatase YjhB (NUDIX family)
MQNNKYDKPICTVDAVLLRIRNEQLEVGLIKRPNDARVYAGVLALPGGFVFTDIDQTINDTLIRNLNRKVGLNPTYTTKLDFDGNATRDPEGWSITCPFVCIVDNQTCDSELLEWFSISSFLGQTPDVALPFDHMKLVKDAFYRLYNRAKYSTEPNHFLAEDFTLSELQKVYEIILGKELHKKNFRDRIEESGSVEETGKTKIVKRSKAKLYRNTKSSVPHFFSRVMQGAYDNA